MLGAAASYGVTPANVADALETLSNGEVVSQIVEGLKRYDVVVRLPEGERTTAELSNLLIETPRGPVPLSNLAEIRDTEGPNQILRENSKRRIVVSANAAPGANLGTIIEAVEKEVGKLKLPAGGFVRVEGQYEAQREATLTIGGLSLVSFGLIFALLFSRYRSATLALIVMAGVPMALVGSVIASRNGILKISIISTSSSTRAKPGVIR